MKYRITTLSPVVISTISGDMNMVATEKYIPGTSVLGLLVRRFIAKKNLESAHENNVFYNWFLAGRVKIGNAYLFSPDESGEKKIYYPTPISIEKEKYYGKTAYDH
ncbi:MAG: RAMP superfamily CRISPR-associated protein, partial [bacterium]